MPGTRKLIIVADDFGIGPDTDRGILETGLGGRLTATVMLVNTPSCEAAVESWNDAGRPFVVGWHPNLTLDAPILPAKDVPSLVQPDGRFWPLGAFLKRAVRGRLNVAEIAAELAAQHKRFIELIGHPPRVVNSHQHTSIFEPARSVLIDLLASQKGPKPYLRRVQEQKGLMLGVPGARIKRAFLSHFGKQAAKAAEAKGLPGADWLIGITDPPCTADERFWTRWLRKVKGDFVELGCHPGYADKTLLVRDVPGKKYDLIRREHEMRQLLRDDFTQAMQDTGFEMVPPADYQSLRLAQAA
jgi:chitin disaccharide deacetylase